MDLRLDLEEREQVVEPSVSAPAAAASAMEA